MKKKKTLKTKKRRLEILEEDLLKNIFLMSAKVL